MLSQRAPGDLLARIGPAQGSWPATVHVQPTSTIARRGSDGNCWQRSLLPELQDQFRQNIRDRICVGSYFACRTAGSN